MAEVRLDPYLFFDGNCKEAMEFYKGIFGGELVVQTMAETPKEAQAPGAKPTDVMHASLKGPITLMASDGTKASPKAAKIELALGGSDEVQLRKFFDGLAEGAEVRMPLKKQFWGDVFGMLTDKYGIDWMVNIASEK